VKTAFDLPNELVRRAKALAAQQKRPLRDWVTEAIAEKLEVSAGGNAATMNAGEVRREAWKCWKGRLERRSDGTWFNPNGVDDEAFFQSLEEIRREPRAKRDPFGGDGSGA
jgi:hypothetical protein